MRLAQLPRRSVAVLAAAALLTTGGFVAGVQTASAAVGVTLNPPGAPNEGVRTFTVNGSFYPTGQQVITVTRQGAVVGQGEPKATEQANYDSCSRGATPSGLGVPDDACSKVVFTIDLNNVAPGTYDVKIEKYRTADVVFPQETYNGTLGVATNGAPNASSSKLFTGTVLPPDGKIELGGVFLAKGSTVDFLLGDQASVDTGLTFTPTVDGGTAGNGYVSSTVLRGTVAQGSFTAGPHYVRVTNAVGQSTVSSSPIFVQPRLSTLSPATLGQGALRVPVTFLGGGFEPESTLFIKETGTATGAAAGIGVGDITVSADGRTLTTTISVAATAVVGTRDVTVRSPSGGFSKLTAGLTITASPKVTSVAPNNRGQGFLGDVTITGTALSSATAFDFGSGITAVTKSSASATNAVVNLTIAPDAVLGAHPVIATNPDFGTSTLANGFTVNAKPLITRVTPASALRGESKTVDLFGTGFVSGATVTSAPAGLSITQLRFVSSTQLSATFQPDVNLPSGTSTFDLTVTNPDGGTSTRPQGYGVNSLTVVTTAVTNATTPNITLQAPNLNGNSVVTLTLASATDQQPLRVSVINVDGVNQRITVSANLIKAAAGFYTVTATDANGATLICTGCLNVISAYDPNSLAIDPVTGGQGATSRTITVSSTNAEPAKSGLSRGQALSLGAGTSTRSTTYNAATDTLTAVVDIAANAAPGTRDVVVTNVGQPGSTGTKVGGFTVTAAPTTTAIAPDTIGQGASLELTLTGTGYQEGATVALSGDGLSFAITAITATEIKGNLDVAPNATTTAPRSVTVTNPDGGTFTPTVQLAIVPKPVVTDVSPGGGKQGDTLTGVVFTGTGFDEGTSGEGDAAVSNMALSIADVTVTNITVTSPTQLTADLAISASAALGGRTVFVSNTANGGRSTLANGFSVSGVPVAPSVSVTPGKTSAKVDWIFPSAQGSDGGSPITGYVVDDGDPATDNTQTVPADARTFTFTGLTGGKTLTFKVSAVNSVGTGQAGTATGTPYDAPLAPTTVNAQSGDGSITVSFSGADPRGSTITEYTARVSTSAGEVVKTGTGSPITITGLANGTTYNASVKASNLAGYGSYSTVAASATPTAGSVLTSVSNVTYSESRRPILFKGSLKQTDGRPIVGERVAIRLVPDIGGVRVARPITNANGDWSFRYGPLYNTTVESSYAGGDKGSAATSGTYKINVFTLMTLVSPRSGERFRAG